MCNKGGPHSTAMMHKYPGVTQHTFLRYCVSWKFNLKFFLFVFSQIGLKEKNTDTKIDLTPSLLSAVYLNLVILILIGRCVFVNHMHCMHMSLLCLRCWVWREVLWSYASCLALNWNSSTPDAFYWYHCRSLSLFGDSAKVWKVTACMGRQKIMKINKTTLH